MDTKVQTYKDIPGWFSERSANALEDIIRKNEIKSVLEIGSFLGRSTGFFAEYVGPIITVVDPFVAWPEGEDNGDAKRAGADFHAKFLKNMEDLGACVTDYRMTSEEAFNELPELRSDLIYIDAAHDYESVKKDIEMWRTRANKVICGDDFDENWPGVIRAVGQSFPSVHLSGNLWYVIL